MFIHLAPLLWNVNFTLSCLSCLVAKYLLQCNWIVRAAVISADRSRRRAARYARKVTVTFLSGIVLLMSAYRISIGTPPSSLVCGKLRTVNSWNRQAAHWAKGIKCAQKKHYLFVKHFEVLLLIVEHLFVQLGIVSVGVRHGAEWIVEGAIEVWGLSAGSALRRGNRCTLRDVLAAKEWRVIMVEEEAKGAAVREGDSQIFYLEKKYTLTLL